MPRNSHASISSRALAILATLVAASLLPITASARSPSYVQVVEKEYTLTLSRLKVAPGPVILQAINFGMDNHDLVVQRNAKGAKPIIFKVMAPNERVTRTLNLVAGSYT